MTSSRARATGAVFVLYVLTATLAGVLASRAPIAYSNIANVAANAVYFAYSLLLYQMFKPVSRGLALLAVTICLAGCVVQSLALFHFVSARSSLPVFGLFNLTIGYLMIKSTFLPRILGFLMMFSGLGWLTVLSPEVIKHIVTFVIIAGGVGEGSLILWLLVRGVNVQRWNEQAGIAPK